MTHVVLSSQRVTIGDGSRHIGVEAHQAYRRAAGREVGGRIDGYDGVRIVREAIEVVRVARRGVDNVRAKQIVTGDLGRVGAHIHQEGLFFAAVTDTESAADH